MYEPTIYERLPWHDDWVSCRFVAALALDHFSQNCIKYGFTRVRQLLKRLVDDGPSTLDSDLLNQALDDLEDMDFLRGESWRHEQCFNVIRDVVKMANYLAIAKADRQLDQRDISGYADSVLDWMDERRAAEIEAHWRLLDISTHEGVTVSPALEAAFKTAWEIGAYDFAVELIQGEKL